MPTAQQEIKMGKQTFIKGKDLALEVSIKSMQKKLMTLGVFVEQASWLNPVPYVHSVHIRDTSCNLMFTNGKGTSEKSCLASALGEYFERLSCNYFFADFYLGEEISQAEFVHYPNEKWFITDSNNTIPDGLLDEKLWHYFNPEKTLKAHHLYDTNSGTGERGICACPYQRQSDKKNIWFPISIISNIYVSNGMSAGNTKYEARVQSLSEIFERFVKNKIIAEGISLPQIPTQQLKKYPKIIKAINKLEQHGFQIELADASLGGLYPVICVTLINPNNATVFASFGAHPNFEIALERTVTELLQGRDLNQLNDFQTPSFDLDAVADHHNLESHFIDSSGLIAYDFFKQPPQHQFVDWNFDGSTEEEFNYLCKTIQQMDFDVYIADYEHLGVYSCRIIVPSMSDIYPVDDLEWNNNNEGALFRKDLLQLKKLNKKQWYNIYQRLEKNAYNDYQRVAEFIGIAPDKNTVWARLRIGELKAMLCLAMQHEDAIDWVNWCLDIEQLNQETTLHYLCLKTLLKLKHNNLELKQYEKHLAKLFSEQQLLLCKNIIQAKEVFYQLHCSDLTLQGFNLHLKLLDVYKKLQKAKQPNH